MPAESTLARPGARALRLVWALAHGLCIFSPTSLSSPTASNSPDASTPRCGLCGLAPPAAHRWLWLWRRPIFYAGLKEEEKEARHVPWSLLQPRALAAMAPTPLPSPEPRRPAWTDMGFRVAPACTAAASATASRAEQRRCPRLCPQPLALLLLLLLSLGQLHAGDCQQPTQCRIQKCTTHGICVLDFAPELCY